MGSSSESPLDIELIEKLSELPTKEISQRVYRATAKLADPITFSRNGGRWAPPANILEIPALYTSFEPDGAKREISSYLGLLTPPPSRQFVVHEIELSARSVITLDMQTLQGLGVERTAYSGRDYAPLGSSPASLTQRIGAGVSFLEHDGLVVPSARFDCWNLILYGNNHHPDSVLEVVQTEEFDWKVYS